MPMPQKGDVLGSRYVLLEEIGSGGYGTVFRGRDKTKSRIVAIKILRSDLADDPDYVRRFRREASIAELLDSRHIVRVFEAGHARLGSQDVHFQVMEHVEGPTLQQLNDAWRPALTQWGIQQNACVTPIVCTGIPGSHGIIAR
jgi:serine/threonine-protein kinase